MGELLEIAKKIQDNNKDEAVAIAGYTELLRDIYNTEIDVEYKEKCNDFIQEIIADELNHQKKLQELYSMLTSIEPNKD